MARAMQQDGLHFETIAVHGDAPGGNHVVLPIHQTSTFAFESGDDMRRAAGEVRGDRFYTRYGNPNAGAASAIIAALEGAQAAMLMASGMGAISTAILGLVKSGDHVVVQQQVYASTRSVANTLLPRFGVESTLVDQADVSAFTSATRSNTTLFVLETPSNPLGALTDLAAVCAFARERGIVTIVDNTVATPYNQRPLSFGADVVAHSATKYLGGHSDIVCGAVAGSETLLERIWHTHVMLGSVPSPFDAFLLTRGLRTLEMRMQRHNANGLALAQFFEKHPRISRVFYPGLASHPQHALAQRQMRGYSGLMSFEIDGSFDDAQRVAAALKLVKFAVSLGGVESLISQPAAMWPSHGQSASAADAYGVTPSMLRLSCGVENVEDLIADFEAALATL